jgi:hypothetical protein
MKPMRQEVVKMSPPEFYFPVPLVELRGIRWGLMVLAVLAFVY